MDLDRALAHIEDIHNHLAKTKTYRGVNSAALLASALSAALAAFLQPVFVASNAPRVFAIYWSVIGALNILFGGGAVAWRYFFQEDNAARRLTEQVVGQFIPCLAAGLAVALGVFVSPLECIPLLPGVWALLYSLGAFAARPWLPHGIGWVALYYLAAGTVLLARRDLSLHPAAMGLAFGVGQAFTALILYWNCERKSHGKVG